MKRTLLLSFLWLFSIQLGWGQCAMCRTTLENNVSNGEAGIASTLNFGILYLFVTPYLLIGVVAYFWYKNSRKNASKKSLSSYN
ncbi:MAG: hypothetical protein OEW67_01510 [Cyclobacteriaceae bacterium]|nr:hypothetical protein [Cyclobacteriaceae bacterium]